MFKDIDSKSAKDLWKIDLEKLLEIYKKDLKKYNDIMNNHINSEITKINSKKKKTSKK